MSDDWRQSVTQWIAEAKAGDSSAAENLWERYFGRVVELARKRMGAAPRRVADEEDIAVSVFDTLCRGAAGGRFTELKDRDDLWRLLLVITRQKSVNQVRRQTRKKRGDGAVRGDSVFWRVGNEEREGVLGITADGATDAFDKALRKAIHYGPDVVYFLTDAEDISISDAELGILTRNNKGAVIHTIKFGEGATERVPWLLKLSRQNSGQYRYVDTRQFGRR